MRISGQAGNVQGKIQPGGNPFEGPRARGYPLPPLKRSSATTKFDKAAKEAGFKPFPCAAANTSQPYKNPYGVQMGECTYCGFCEWFACGNYSKSSPQTTILPVLLKKDNFSYRTNCDVTRVNLDSSGKRATGVTYVDVQGREYEQPAELVILCAFAQHNVHLLLLSKIGQPYDPKANQGVTGRNYAYQITSSVNVFLDEILNPFMGRARSARPSMNSTATTSITARMVSSAVAISHCGQRAAALSCSSTEFPRVRPNGAPGGKRRCTKTI